MKNKNLGLGSGKSFSIMLYHIIWSTKYRFPYLTPKIKKAAFNYIERIATKQNWNIIAIGGIEDHIHILIQKEPKYSISKIMCCLKASSSKFIRENFIENFMWQKGYSVFTVDAYSIEKIKSYINNQEERHKKISFDNEFVNILENYS